jgi:hypothetical protein
MTMRSSPVCFLLAFVVCSLELSSPARSQPLDRVATAEALFEQGRTLVEAGDLANACPRFLASQQLDPGVGTLLWLADCYAGSGRTASAWIAFGEAVAAATRNQDRRVAVAIAKRNELEKRLSRLALLVPPEADAEGLQVFRDGALLDRNDWSVAVPVDPGPHVLSASAPRRRPWTANVRIATGPTSLAVPVPILEIASETEAPPSSHDVAPVTEDAKAPRQGLGGQRWIGIASMGLGAVGLIAGTFWSLQAKANYDQSTTGPCGANGTCTQTGLDERSSAHTMATEATVAMGIGAVAIATGAIVFFTAPQRASSVAVAPAAWPSGASMTISGAF